MCNEAHSFEMLHISVKCWRSSNYMYIWKRLLLRLLEHLSGECVRFYVIRMCVFTFGCACACVHHNDEQIKTVHHLSFIQNLTQFISSFVSAGHCMALQSKPKFAVEHYYFIFRIIYCWLYCLSLRLWKHSSFDCFVFRIAKIRWLFSRRNYFGSRWNLLHLIEIVTKNQHKKLDTVSVFLFFFFFFFSIFVSLNARI